MVYILHVVPIMKFDFWKMPMLKNLLCTPQLNPIPVSLCWFNELQYIIFFLQWMSSINAEGIRYFYKVGSTETAWDLPKVRLSKFNFSTILSLSIFACILILFLLLFYFVLNLKLKRLTCIIFLFVKYTMERYDWTTVLVWSITVHHDFDRE